MTFLQADVTSRAEAASAGLQGQIGTTTQTCPKVTLEIGVFFDGTLNNAANAGQGESGSYANARSNVALLSQLYKRNSRHWIRNSCGGYDTKYSMLYLSGIGTTDGEKDSNFPGAAMGMGATGIEAIVYKACLDVGRIVTELSPGIEPTEIVMDVFGFSRGAGAARYFVNCFRQGFVAYMRNYTRPDVAYLPKDRKVRFRFVGVFETVAAVGLGTNDNNGDVNVHLSTAQAKRLHHLTAMNEYRENFRLNHNIPGGGTTHALPGAHSDIGGGYRAPGDTALIQRVRSSPAIPGREEIERLHRSYSDSLGNRDARRRAQEEAIWISEGWLNPNETEGGVISTPGPIKSRDLRLPIGGKLKTYYFEYGQRLSRPWVQIGLSRVALRMMYDTAMSEQVPFLAYPDDPEFTLPPDLQALGQKLISGATLSQTERRYVLRNFGHVSSQSGSMGMAPDRDHRRIIYPNEPAQAR